MAGPAPNNKLEFFDLQRRITGKPTPPIGGRMRFEPEGLPICQDMFKKVEYEVFKNPVTFSESDPFVDYVRASISEDPHIWDGVIPDAAALDLFCGKVAQEVSSIIARDGQFTMNKMVGGILGRK